jgi:hypothetical protein
MATSGNRRGGPDLGEAGSGVGRNLAVPIIPEGGVRHFDDEEHVGGTGTLRANRGFGTLGLEEFRKLRRRRSLDLAGELGDEAGAPRAWRWGTPGVPAQLVDLRTHCLEMAFRIEGDGWPVHALNAVSPAFTCAFSFADLVLTRIADPSDQAASSGPRSIVWNRSNLLTYSRL